MISLVVKTRPNQALLVIEEGEAKVSRFVTEAVEAVLEILILDVDAGPPVADVVALFELVDDKALLSENRW